MASLAAIHRKAAELGKLTVRMTAKSGSGHPSTGLALGHITAYLMYEYMRYDPSRPNEPGADRLVLSEGHAVPIIYAAYADLGGTAGRPGQEPRPLTIADLDELRAMDSVLDGHPNPAEGIPFFDAATGSLGMGLSVGAGLAAGARLDGSDRRVFVIIGDGESREGQIWEAADFIVDHKLTNLCAIFSANGHGQADAVSAQQSADALMAKLTAFGWEAVEIDGHNPDEIAAALEKFGKTEKPLAIVARTVKGWGVDQLLNGNWHGKPLKEADLDAANASLDKAVESFGTDGEIGQPQPAPAVTVPDRVDPAGVEWPSYEEAMESGGFGDAVRKGKLATRKAYGAALKVAGDLIPQLVVLDGDVSNSTFAEIFAKAHPDRFFECKIAEQNMVSAAAGLSAAGYIPFANSFAKFLSRATDQIEMANISRANLKIVGSHAGISLAADGPSQMSVTDVAFFGSYGAVRGDDRQTPLCWSYQPADARAAYACTQLMIANSGMDFMRTLRPDLPLLYGEDATFEPGGFNTLETGDDLTIIAAGYMVHEARKAIEKLASQNIRATLVDVYSLPLKDDSLAEVAQRGGKAALVVEDNYGCGLGAIVAQLAAKTNAFRVETLCCQRIPKSTRSADDVLEYCGLSAAQIADHATALIRRP